MSKKIILKFFFSNLLNLKAKNYYKVDLEIKNKINKKFKNALVFNVLEHVHNDMNAIDELGKLLKKEANFIFQLHFYTDFMRLQEITKDILLIILINY